MVQNPISNAINRRRILQGGAAIGLVQVASPFIIKARGETTVKIGFIDPITGSLSAPHDRYQSRIMWLPPFIAVLSLASLRARPAIGTITTPAPRS